MPAPSELARLLTVYQARVARLESENKRLKDAHYAILRAYEDDSRDPPESVLDTICGISRRALGANA